MRQKLALTALAALAAASSPGGPDDAEAALRNLLTSLRPVYSKWKEADTPEQQPPAPPAVGAAPWVRAATDLRDATPADVALAALGGAARGRAAAGPNQCARKATTRGRQPRGCGRRRPGAAEAAPPAAAQPPPVAFAAQPPPAFAAAAAAWTAAHGKGAFYARDGEVLVEPQQHDAAAAAAWAAAHGNNQPQQQQERRGFWRPHAHVQQPPKTITWRLAPPARPPQVEELHNKLKQFDEAGVMGAVYRGGACLFACGVLAFCSVAQPDRLTNAAYNLRYKETLGRILVVLRAVGPALPRRLLAETSYSRRRRQGLPRGVLPRVYRMRGVRGARLVSRVVLRPRTFRTSGAGCGAGPGRLPGALRARLEELPRSYKKAVADHLRVFGIVRRRTSTRGVGQALGLPPGDIIKGGGAG